MYYAIDPIAKTVIGEATSWSFAERLAAHVGEHCHVSTQPAFAVEASDTRSHCNYIASLIDAAFPVNASALD